MGPAASCGSSTGLPLATSNAAPGLGGSAFPLADVEQEIEASTAAIVSPPARPRRPTPVVSQTVLGSLTRLRLPAVLAVVVAGLSACASEKEPAAVPGTSQPAPTVGVTAATPPTSPTSALPPTTTVTEPDRATSQEPATVVHRGDPNRRTVALTFDAGSDLGFASQILDTLEATTVRATFGITGKWAEQHADLVRRMAASGHLVINHTYEHRSFTGVSARPALVSAAERTADIERTDEIIRNLTGRTTRPWFRSPYGDYDASVNATLGSLGYRYNVLWTVDSLGWQGLPPAAILSRCLQGTVPGAILLFHVGSQSQDAAALPAIISGLRQNGYDFGTVADVLGS